MSLLAADRIDLSGAWNGVWTTLSNALGSGLLKVMTAAGVIMLALAIVTFLWQKRRGRGGGDNGGLIWTIVFATLLASPGVVLPMFLKIIDVLVNFFIDLWNGSVGG